MGELLGKILGEVTKAIGDAVDRKSIAKAIRGIADKIDRGELVPDAMLARAKRAADKLAKAREKYRS